MEGPRLQILNLLQRHHGASVDTLAKEVKLAPATVRRHLDILQRDRLVAYRSIRQKTGRPGHVFYLTEEGQEVLPKGYQRLLNLMLEELGLWPNNDGANGPLVKLLMGRVARQVAQRHRQDIEGKQTSQRIAAALAILEEEQFAPEVDNGKSELRFILHNCPFRAAALKNRDVCSFDQQLLSTILGQEASLQRCINNGDSHCCYGAPVPDPLPDAVAAGSSSRVGS
ncbi:MAG: ArsR family transcriptional regulator [Chloroflexi bacterium]|nr:ArsR family transcriptional regulator [Chloroflexota bacterium]